MKDRVTFIVNHLVWFQNYEVHRDGGKPAVIGPNGYREWYSYGELREYKSPQ